VADRFPKRWSRSSVDYRKLVQHCGPEEIIVGRHDGVCPDP
jgi:hypothetical protein